MKALSAKQRSPRRETRVILESIAGVEEVIAGKTLAQYSRDWLAHHAAERGMEIISEATSRLPAELLSRRPEVDWRQVVGLGEIVRRSRPRSIDELVFNPASLRLETLKAAVLAIEASLDEPEE